MKTRYEVRGFHWMVYNVEHMYPEVLASYAIDKYYTV